MKKAEIIKNGNVNLQPTKQIDWYRILDEYRLWYLTEWNKDVEIHPIDCFRWLRKKLS